MYKKKTLLTAILLAILAFSGTLLNVRAEEKKPATTATETQATPEETQIPQAPKKPKKDSTPKKEKPKKNSENSSETHQKSENGNSKNTEEKKESEKQQKKEPDQQKEEKEKSLDLPNVNNSEVELKPYFSQISQNTEGKNILKTIISWLLILSGVFLILKVILSNKKIPKNYTFGKKSKHAFIPHKSKTNKYKF